MKKPFEQIRILKKTFLKTQSLLINKNIKNKRSLELVTFRSSGYETSSKKSLS